MSEVTDVINTAEAVPLQDIVAPVVNQTPAPEPTAEQIEAEVNAVSKVDTSQSVIHHEGETERLAAANEEAARASTLTTLVAAAPLVQQVAEAIGIPVSREEFDAMREEFDAMREELDSLNDRIANFNQRSGQKL